MHKKKDHLIATDKDYQKKFDQAEEEAERMLVKLDKELPNSTEEERREIFNKAYAVVDSILDEWRAETRRISKEAKDIADNWFRKEGYDGFVLDKDSGSFGRSVNTTVAFNPNQIKSAIGNIGTFSDRPNILHQFIGERGAAALDRARESTIRLDNLAVARDMEAANKDANTIKLATGWERGADNKWRYEVDDSGVDIEGYEERLIKENQEAVDKFELVADAKRLHFLADKGWNVAVNRFMRTNGFSPAAESIELAKKHTLEELGEMEQEAHKAVSASNALRVRHFMPGHEVLKAYPEIADMRVSIEGLLANWGGLYEDGKGIALNTMHRDKHASILMHEVQHAIQYIEGFAKGGSHGLFEDEFINNIRAPREKAAIRLKMLWEKVEDSPEYKKYQEADRRFHAAKTDEDWEAIQKEFPGVDDPADLYTAGEAYKEFARAEAEYKEKYGDDFTIWLDGKRSDEVRRDYLFKQYQRLAGETEARNVSRRYNMSPEERRESLAAETEDVAREDQRILFQMDEEWGTFGFSSPEAKWRATKIPNSMMALHSLKAENLIFAEQLGGLAVPSIGVVGEDRGELRGFGEITLIGTKDLGDPSKNPVFSADAWTARFPTPQYKPITKEKKEAVLRKFQDAIARLGNGDRYGYYDIKDGLEKEDKRKFRWGVFSSIGKLAWLQSIGKDVPYVMTDNRKTKLSKEQIEELRPDFNEVEKWIDDFSKKNKRGPLDRDIEDVEAWKRLKAKYEEMVFRHLKKEYPHWDGAKKEAEFYLAKMGILRHDMTTSDEILYKKRIDYSKTEQKIVEAVKQYDQPQGRYWRWAEDIVEDAFGPQYVDAENDKLWTLDNIVEKMKSSAVKGEETDEFYFGKLAALGSKRFSDIEEMRKKAKEVMRDSEEHHAQNRRLEQTLFDYELFVREERGINSDQAKRALAHVLAIENPTRDDMREAFKQEGFDDLSEEVLQEGVNTAKALKNEFRPDYFESKPQRAVRLDEFAGAVVPENLSREARAVLERNNLPIFEYQSKDNITNVVREAAAILSQRGERTLFQFVGERGAEALDRANEATTRIDNLSVAREMETAGKDAKTIKLATGWERGVDGKWRYEVDDSGVDIEGYEERRAKEESEAREKLAQLLDAVKLRENADRYGLDDAIESYTRRNEKSPRAESVDLAKKHTVQELEAMIWGQIQRSEDHGICMSGTLCRGMRFYRPIPKLMS